MGLARFYSQLDPRAGKFCFPIVLWPLWETIITEPAGYARKRMNRWDVVTDGGRGSGPGQLTSRVLKTAHATSLLASKNRTKPTTASWPPHLKHQTISSWTRTRCDLINNDGVPLFWQPQPKIQKWLYNLADKLGFIFPDCGQYLTCQLSNYAQETKATQQIYCLFRLLMSVNFAESENRDNRE